MTWWFWIVLGLALLGLELALPGGFFLVFFGVAALALGGMTVLFPALSIGLGWVIFSVLSVVLLLAFRQRLVAVLGSSSAEPVDQLVGQEVLVTEDIAAGAQGGVSLRGAPWRAENQTAAVLLKGSRCRVTAVEGVLLKVG